jgi:outer membrane protein
MKKFFLIATFLLFGTVLTSSAVKIGIVDLETIAQSLDEAKKAEKDLQALAQRYQDTLVNMQRQLEESLAAYQKQKTMMPNEQQMKAEQELQMQQTGLQQYYQERLGQQGLLFQKRAEVLEPIRNSILVAINKVAKKEKVSLVLDKNGPSVLYTQSGDDLTFKVLDLMKRGK